MYDFIYPKIEEGCLTPYLLQKYSWKKNYELTGIKLA